MSKCISPTKIVTGPDTRWSYVNVWEAKSVNGGNPRYSISLIIPKNDTDTISYINRAINAAYKAGLAKLKGNASKVPALSEIKTPLHDGDLDKPDDEAYKNAYFINAASTRPPEICDADLNGITDHSAVYSGAYGRASISFYAYNYNGNRGIACGLNGLQKISDGEQLGAKTNTITNSTANNFDDFLR